MNDPAQHAWSAIQVGVRVIGIKCHAHMLKALLLQLGLCLYKGLDILGLCQIVYEFLASGIHNLLLTHVLLMHGEG